MNQSKRGVYSRDHDIGREVLIPGNLPGKGSASAIPSLSSDLSPLGFGHSSPSRSTSLSHAPCERLGPAESTGIRIAAHQGEFYTGHSMVREVTARIK